MQAIASFGLVVIVVAARSEALGIGMDEEDLTARVDSSAGYVGVTLSTPMQRFQELGGRRITTTPLRIQLENKDEGARQLSEAYKGKQLPCVHTSGRA